MTDRPIIFSAPMVRALLEGRKTMTRRLAWRVAPEVCMRDTLTGEEWLSNGKPSPWQKGAPGDRLWVRENFTTRNDGSRAVPKMVPMYAADFDGFDEPDRDWKWTPSIHMPRWASRLTLEVTATKIERLQKITSAEAIMEGCPPHANSQTIDCDTPDPRDDFAALWRRLHGAGAWDANPEVVALTFKVHQQNIDAMKAAA